MLGSPFLVTCISISIGATSRSQVRHREKAEKSLAEEPRRGEIRYQTDGRSCWRVAKGIQEGFLEDSVDTGGIGDKNLRVSLSHM